MRKLLLLLFPITKGLFNKTALNKINQVYWNDKCSGAIWRNGESARLPPMCPGFDSWTRRHMWIEFVVGSRPFSERFSPGSPVFLPPQKPTILNSNLFGNSRATGLPVEDCCVSPSLNKVNLFIIYFNRNILQQNIS